MISILERVALELMGDKTEFAPGSIETFSIEALELKEVREIEVSLRKVGQKIVFNIEQYW